MNRRGFFSKLFGPKMPYRFFFGIQAVIGIYAKDNLREELHNILNNKTEQELPKDKKAFYKAVSSVLLDCFHAIEYAYWDYILKPTEAEDEFHGWINEIEANIATEEAEMGKEINEIHRLSNDKSYISVTMVFLLEGSERLKQFMDIIESIPDDETFFRNAIKKIIEAINYINFEYSYGDACFIMPGNEEDGLSWEDIHSEGWEYLKAIV